MYTVVRVQIFCRILSINHWIFVRWFIYSNIYFYAIVGLKLYTIIWCMPKIDTNIVKYSWHSISTGKNTVIMRGINANSHRIEHSFHHFSAWIHLWKLAGSFCFYLKPPMEKEKTVLTNEKKTKSDPEPNFFFTWINSNKQYISWILYHKNFYTFTTSRFVL